MPATVKFSGTKKMSIGIKLPASKSISNRALIIRAIGGLECDILNLSEADDTQVLDKILKEKGQHIYAGDGGTTLRFLLAYLSLSGDDVNVTASEALMKRPVSDLLDALRSLGAEFEFGDEANKLPLKIKKSKLTGGSISISGETSSQFVSAMMMIGPYLKNGLNIDVTGELLSWPYVLMTGKLMQYFGVQVTISGNLITIPEGKYTAKDLIVEPDWSAASYWYEIAALLNEAEIFLEGLTENSLQGDAVIATLMNELGVKTEFKNDGVALSKINSGSMPDFFSADLSGCPDLGLALAATLGGLNIASDLENLKNFRLKESDRAVAMQRGLYDLNVKTDFCGGSKFKIYEGAGVKFGNREVKTFNDHRIAMAFAPLAIITGKIVIQDHEVVKKSYPGFYNDLKKAGFEIEIQ